MKRKPENTLQIELVELCKSVRALVNEKRYEECLPVICRAMEEYPHSPAPHNLLGVVLEKLGDHLTAMKHFRAAWALDPMYSPASHNLKTYGTFFSNGSCAFDESDVPEAKKGNTRIIYDERGIGCAVSRATVEYDRYGIGRIVRR